MEQKEEKPSEDGTTVSPTPGTSGTPGGEANGLDEVKVESKVEAELPKVDSGKEETKEAPQEMTGGKEETNSEPKEAEGKEGTVLATEKQKAEEKAATPESREKADVEDQAKAELKQGAGEPEAGAGSREADGEQEATTASREESAAESEEPKAEVQAKASAPEATRSGCGERVGGRAGVSPSSPEEWPESPTEEGQGLSPGDFGETSPSASESSPSEVPQSPTEPPPSQEKKKEKAPERRVTAPARPRGARAQNRKAIVDKFGGAASGPTALFRNTKAAGAAIGSVKNMLLEWCRAMTRNYEHVDIQNFSSSWSSGMAFCALIHKFFPDAFDYAELDPTKRRHNFTLAFSTAEKLADCAQLLEVDDMVRLAVPDSKCVYTYIQELYRCLVQKGLVKTKKK
ncbi:hypothetical protein QTO34_003594 [Cnephaeus nilssonii]|uniref:Calponin-homology (CH) domain-containing protein n=1 Tax=Cnephaeus nilssonii TaxID=3371016 RepID=A0AA40HQZ1_CNENI|nr:hypothetical protein QTO34_003594 [Eptesicus nilssonii]